ncbi:hypothetical protein IKZ40_01425 [bacterium]|nr:hypothetical protein [bacterium]
MDSEERDTEELEVFRHSRRRSRYHAVKAEKKEKQKQAALSGRRKKDPRPRQKGRFDEEEQW